MENDVISEERTSAILLILILTILLFSFLLNLYLHQGWLKVYNQISAWLSNPEILYTPISIKGTFPGFLATLEILVFGTLASQVLLRDEEDKFLKRISAMGLGFGFTGFITMLLGIFRILYIITLNIMLLLLIVILTLGLFFDKRTKLEWRQVLGMLKGLFSLWKVERPKHFRRWLLLLLPVIFIFAFIFYHSLFIPVVHWDATVYHVPVADIMFRHHGIPLIAGPAVGLPMSANYPPFFSSIGAYYFVQIGAVDDIYLRAIPPLMGLLTLTVVYKIGKTLYNETFGKISAFLLLVSPLFISKSVYALNYTTLLFFVSISALFQLYAIREQKSRYWTIAGIFYGLAMLVSYQAFYFLPICLLAIVYTFARESGKSRRNILIFIFVTSSIGSTWYIRNIVLLGNPVYPFFHTILGGKYIYPPLVDWILSDIRISSIGIFYGTLTPSIIDWVLFPFINRLHYPAISVLSLLGIAIGVALKRKSFWFILALALSPYLILQSGVSFVFPRYFLLPLPGFALLAGLPITYAIEQYRSFSKLARNNGRVVGVFIILVLGLTILFPTLPHAIGGKLSYVTSKPFSEPPDDILFFLTHPGVNNWTAMEKMFGDRVKSWKWVNDHLNDIERIATFETEVYYIKNYENILYLDGWEAIELYRIEDQFEMIRFLKNRNVTYIVDQWYMHGWPLYQWLPLNKFLGSPYFPAVYWLGGGRVLHVGPVTNPIITDPLYAYINQEGWTDLQIINGKLAKSVIMASDRPRLYVNTQNLTLVEITYLDKGEGKLDFNLRVEANKWLIPYTAIVKEGSNTWKNHKFLLPANQEKGFAELGLYARGEDFTISKIQATPSTILGKVALTSLKGDITNITCPPTLMVYFPILRGGEKIMVQTDSHGKNISVEIFEGVIQPQETSDWWIKHAMVARSPKLPIFCEENPSLVWEAKQGFYTLVIVLWDVYEPGMKVDLSVSVGCGR